MRLTVIVVLALLAGCKQAPDNPAPAKTAISHAKVPPQAQPMLAVLESIKTGNTDQFVNAFSTPIRAEFRSGLGDGPGNDPKTTLQDATQCFEGMHGDYQLADVTFTYEGTETSGTLDVFLKGKQISRPPVINENGQWKLDSH
jgi:hypothetical protein